MSTRSGSSSPRATASCTPNKKFSECVSTTIFGALADATGETFDGTTPFTRTMLLHGVKKPVTGTAEIHSEGTSRRVRAEFPLVLTDWGVTPPEYLGVGVGSRLLVKVTLTATPVRPPAR